MDVDAATTPSLVLGQPEALFTRAPLSWDLVFGLPAWFDVSSDGERFLVCQPVEENRSPATFVVVQSWMSEFGRKQ